MELVKLPQNINMETPEISGQLFDDLYSSIRNLQSSLGEVKGDWETFVNYMNSTRLDINSLSDSYFEQDDKRSLRARWGVKNLVAGRGSDIGAMWNEAQEVLGHGFFPDNIWESSAQFEHLLALLEKGREIIRSNKITQDEIQEYFGGREGIAQALQEIISQVQQSSVELSEAFIHTNKAPHFEQDNATLEMLQKRVQAIRENIDELAAVKIKTTPIMDEETGEVIDRVSRAVIEYTDSLGRSAKEAYGFVKVNKEVAGQLVEVAEFSHIGTTFDENTAKIRQNVQEIKDFTKEIYDTLNNLMVGQWSDAEQGQQEGYRQSLMDISKAYKDKSISIGETEQRLESLNKQVLEFIALSKKGELHTDTGLNFKSNKEDIGAYIAQLKGLSAEKAHVTELQKNLVTAKSGEQMRTATVMLEEQTGVFREFVVTLSSANDEIRVMDNSISNVHTNLAAKASILNARLVNEINEFQSAFKAKIDNLAMGNISDIDKTALRELQTQINGITVETENAQAKMKEYKATLKELQNNIKLGTPTGGKLDIGITERKDELRDYIAAWHGVDEALVEVNGKIRDKFTETGEKIRFVNFKIAGEGVDSWEQYQLAINSVTGEVRELHQGTKELGETASNTVITLGNLLTAGGIVKGLRIIIRYFQQATKAAAEFESSLASIRKVTDLSVEGMSNLRRELVEMSRQVPMNINQLAEITTALGRMGIAEESLALVTRTMADLSVASTLSGEAGATMFARFANLMQLDHSMLDRLGSSLVFLGNQVPATETEIMQLAVRLAAATAQADISAQATVGLAAAMGALAIPAELGGTALQRVLARMSVGVAEMNDDLHNFAEVANMSGEAFAQLFRSDSEEALMRFIEGLADMERTGKNVTETLVSIGITEVRLRDVLTRLAGSGNLLRETIEMSNREFELNTALTREASIRYETLESKVQLLQNAFAELRINIGDGINPSIEVTASILTNLTTKLSDFLENNQWASVAVATLTAALVVGVGAISLYTAGTKLLTLAKTQLKATTLGATMAQKGFTAALIATPIGKIILGITALTAAYVALTNIEGRRRAKQAEALRLEEERAQAIEEHTRQTHQATNALEGYISALADLENRRLNVQGFEEAREINEELLNLQNQIRDSIGSQARELDIVNGAYEEQAEILNRILLTRRQLELSEARTNFVLAQDQQPEIENWDNIHWGNLNRDLRVRAGIDLDDLVGSRTLQEYFNSLDLTAQIAHLEIWIRQLTDARIEGADVAESLSILQMRLEHITGAFDANANSMNSATREFDTAIRRVFELEYPSLSAHLFNPEHAEEALQAYHNTIVNGLYEVWDDVQHIFYGRANTPLEAALILGFEVDTDALLNQLDIVRNFIDGQDFNLSERSQVAELFSAEEINFLINNFSRIGTAADGTVRSINDMREEFERYRAEMVRVNRTTGLTNLRRDMDAYATQLTRLIHNHASAVNNLAREYDQQQINNHMREWLNTIHEINDNELRAEGFRIFEEHAQRAADAIRTVAQAKENLTNIFNDATSEIGNLNRTIESLTENQSLSTDEIIRLIMRYPELTRYNHLN
jgi:TP901 family phage tail tape measure protein